MGVAVTAGCGAETHRCQIQIWVWIKAAERENKITYLLVSVPLCVSPSGLTCVWRSACGLWVQAAAQRDLVQLSTGQSRCLGSLCYCDWYGHQTDQYFQQCALSEAQHRKRNWRSCCIIQITGEKFPLTQTGPEESDHVQIEQYFTLTVLQDQLLKLLIPDWSPQIDLFCTKYSVYSVYGEINQKEEKAANPDILEF